MNKLDRHKVKADQISTLMRKYSESEKRGVLRFYHGSTNSTRPKENKETYFVDISNLNKIIEINTKDKYVWVEPNVSIEQLIKATLGSGLVPPVVMEFPAITVGGAINGASLESSSFKYGQFSDICEEYEVILGNGEIISASKNHNSDLFYGLSGSYGSLCLVSLAKIKLVDSAEYVHTEYYPTTSFQETLRLVKEKIRDEEIDYLEGIIYSPSQGVVITGTRTNTQTVLPKTYSKITDLWFYERVRNVAEKGIKEEELIPITDYLFRYNRGAFWMGEFAFPLLGIPNNKITRFLFNGYAKTHKLFEALQTLNVSQNYFLQDFYFPFDKALNCLTYNEETLGVYPLWLCPIRSTKTLQKLSPHYINSERETLVDVGIYGQTDKYLAHPIEVNKNFENYAKENGARKMLYAHAYYSKDEFWSVYDKSWYEELREKYKAAGIFSDVWQKTHVSGRVIGSRWKGFFIYFFINPLKKLISRLFRKT